MLQLCCVLDRQFSVSFSWSQLHYKCFCYIKDTLKAFDDFKNKQKSAWNNVFWYVNVCIFWNCIHYNIHWDKTQMIKSLPSDKINGTKNAFFFLSWGPYYHSFTFSLRFLYKLEDKVRLSKTVCVIFHFQFLFVFIKAYIFDQDLF